MRQQEIIRNMTQIEREVDEEEEEEGMNDGDANNKPNRSKLYTFLSTICMSGVQFIWTVELSRGTTYLSRLNLPDKITSLVWLAGPLSGLITQPIVGALSDKCTLRLGKRRPFIIVASVLVCCAMLGVAFSKEIGGDAAVVENYDTYDDGRRKFKSSTLAIAILSFYILDFSLNVVQTCSRSLIIDVHPIGQQERANAFAGNISSITNVFGYLVGSLDLAQYIPILNENDPDGQLKIFCFIGILVFCITVTITCFFVKEIPVVVKQEQQSTRLCFVQFFASMAWFPLLFYISAWISNLNDQAILSTTTTLDSKDLDQSDRVGSFALLINSCVAVFIGILFPYMILYHWISIKLAFSFSLAILAIVLLCTFFVHQVTHAYIILALLGIPAACATWIPFSLIGKYLEIEKVVSGGGVIQQKNIKLETGIALGVQNIYVVVPQFIMAFIISSLIFNAVAQEKKGNDVDARVAGIAWVLQFGGLMAILATILSRWIIKV